MNSSAIGPEIASRPVLTIRGNVLPGSHPLPTTIPTGGKFYLSFDPNQLAEVVVDDELVFLYEENQLFTYRFADGTVPPGSTLLEVPRDAMNALPGSLSPCCIAMSTD
ncbi:MAG: hypothetical protein R3E31_20385 [Chloroflexota bacterium]